MAFKNRKLSPIRPALFQSKFQRFDPSIFVSDDRSTEYSTSEKNVDSYNSFALDTYQGFKSTQQIPIDYRLLEEHTFFDSAVSKVNIAFERIINDYPFDGDDIELDNYLNLLTGYENYILTQKFPKNTGYLVFSGTTGRAEPGGDGQFISVKDVKGATFPGDSSDVSGKPVFPIQTSDFAVEFFVMVTVPLLAS